MSERFKVTKFDDPPGKAYKNYGATSAESDVELKGKLLPDSGAPNKSPRLHGGALTTIDKYPEMVAMLYSHDLVWYGQACAGTIINSRAILTSAFCVSSSLPVNWLARVGSSFANIGGTIHSINLIISHPNQDTIFNNDIAIVHTLSDITFIDNLVRAAFFSGSNYNLADNEIVWTAGWGYTEIGPTEQLRDIPLLTINQNICGDLFEEWGMAINDNMFCAGWLGVIGIGQCSGDSGGPVYHNGVVVGVTPAHLSGCGMPDRPGVNVRVSRYIDWIRNNA